MHASMFRPVPPAYLYNITGQSLVNPFVMHYVNSSVDVFDVCRTILS